MEIRIFSGKRYNLTDFFLPFFLIAAAGTNLNAGESVSLVPAAEAAQAETAPAAANSTDKPQKALAATEVAEAAVNPKPVPSNSVPAAYIYGEEKIAKPLDGPMREKIGQQQHEQQTLPVVSATFEEEKSLVPEAGMDEKLNRKVSLDLRDMNIIDVLKFLAIKGDFNILTSKNIEGRVTLLLNNVSIRDALEIILIANDLGYIQKKGIIYVMTGAEYLATNGKKFGDNTKVKIVYLKYARPNYILTALQNIRSNFGKIVIDEDTGTVVMIDTEDKIKEMEKAIGEMEYRTETKVITLMYAKAESVANQLKAKLDAKAVGSIQFDERSNQVVISALPGRMDEIVNIVQALDTKTKAVLIEATLLQVTLNPSYDTGIDWEVAFKSASNSLLRSLDFSGAFPISSVNVGTTYGKIAVGNININDFTIALKALKQVKATKILAHPKLMVVNNHEAKIHIGDTVPYVTSTTTGSGDTATTSETVNWIDIGIQLIVTPTINDNGFVTIKIKPEISSKTGDYLTPKNATIPIVNTTVVDTSVLVKDGSTIIIGGLVKNDKSTVNKGIPGLMNAPLIGGLFKSVSDTMTNSEIVIFITPHISSGETTVPETQGDILGVKNYEDGKNDFLPSGKGEKDEK